MKLKISVLVLLLALAISAQTFDSASVAIWDTPDPHTMIKID